MDISQTVNGDTLNIAISGKFTFADNGPFREVITKFSQPDVKSAVFDFSGLEFIDSAALGMMLLVKEESGKQNVAVSIKNPSGQPGQMFQVARFNDIFTVI